MSYKIDCKNIEMESQVIDKKLMEGIKPVITRNWYCSAGEINDYIDECPYYVKK